MQTVYGVVLSDGSHCDTSHTAQGAKNYATRNGYTQITARRNGGYDAEIIAHRDGGKWLKGPAPFKVKTIGDYVTRAGDRVTVDAFEYENGAGAAVTYPVKGRIWKMYRGEVRPREFKIWMENGAFFGPNPSPWDIVGPWVEG